MTLNHHKKYFNNRQDLCTFLHFSYLPHVKKKPLDFILFPGWQDRRPHLRSLAFADLITEGANSFRETIKLLLEKQNFNAQNLVQISGGLDSRAILAGLLEHLSPKEIQAVTYGTPGTWDYEIGRLVARKTGIRHELIDLTQYQWDLENLLALRNIHKKPFVLFFAALFDLHVRQIFGPWYFYWSGFLGETLSGDHQPPKKNFKKKDAIRYFLKRNNFCRPYSITPQDFEPESLFSGFEWIDSKLLDYDSQLDLGIRQADYIKPLVMTDGYKNLAPFSHPDWISFILNIPYEYRSNQIFYKRMLYETFPKLFRLPVKNNHGLPLFAPAWMHIPSRLSRYFSSKIKQNFPAFQLQENRKVINYLGYDALLRSQNYFQDIIHHLIMDLKNRQVMDWLDLDQIWVDHRDNKKNFAMPLLLLASLEVYLKE